MDRPDPQRDTAVSNLVLLCPRHHALVHEGRDELEQWLQLFDPAFDFDDIPRWDGTRFELGHVLGAVLHAAAA